MHGKILRVISHDNDIITDFTHDLYLFIQGRFYARNRKNCPLGFHSKGITYVKEWPQGPSCSASYQSFLQMEKL